MAASLRGLLIWGLAAVVAGASSCSSLPDIDRGACGNGVVEPEHNEDCDNGVTDDAGHPTCYPAGSAAACHFDCSSVSCPAGFSCGNDAVCRKPSGIFKDTGHVTQIDANHLFVGDFDHDGLGDVVAQTDVQMDVLYGDTAGNLGEPFTVLAPNSNPTIGPLALDPGDSGVSEPNSDIIFSATSGVTTWRGRSDRTLGPTPYPSLEIGPNDSRVVEVRTINPTDDVLVMLPLAAIGAPIPGSVITEITGGESPNTASVFALFLDPQATPTNLVGDIPVARFIDTLPCGGFALAFASGTDVIGSEVTVITTCSDASTLNTFPVKGDAGAAIPPKEVKLPGGAIVRSNGAGVHVGDVDGDGHIDLMVDANVPLGDAGPSPDPINWVAYGKGDGSFTSLPGGAGNPDEFSVFIAGGPILAIGQITNLTDHVADYVIPNAIVLGGGVVPTPDGGTDAGGATQTTISASQTWTDARMVDVNGDGFVDVVAGSPGRVDIFLGRGISIMNHVPYAVDGTSGEFAFGDFDGDRAPDIAFRADHQDGTADLDVMWGKLLGTPENPTVIGRFGGVRSIGEGIIAATLGNNDDIADIGVVTQSVSDDGGATFNVSVLAGETNRQLQAPFYLQQPHSAPSTSRDTGQPFGFSVGQLTVGDHHPDVVSGTVVLRSNDDALDAGSLDGSLPASSLVMELAIAQSTGAAELSGDPARLVFTDKFDSFQSFSSNCGAQHCSLPIADWQHVQLTTVDLDGNADGGANNGVDEIVGVAPALATQNAFHDKSADGALFWARFEGGKWNVKSLLSPGSLPSNGRTPIASVISADLNGDGAADVLALVDGPQQTSLLAFINKQDGSLPANSTTISLPAYSTDPGAPFHIVSIAAIDADSDPGKEVAMLTDNGGLFLAKSNAAGDSFTVTGPLCNGAAPGSCANISGQRIPSGAAIAATDIDGDGIQDLVIESNLTLHVLKGVAVDP